MDFGVVIAAVEEGGLSFIFFIAMLVAIYIAMLITITR
jgi:hypothetical protein